MYTIQGDAAVQSHFDGTLSIVVTFHFFLLFYSILGFQSQGGLIPSVVFENDFWSKRKTFLAFSLDSIVKMSIDTSDSMKLSEVILKSLTSSKPGVIS